MQSGRASMRAGAYELRFCPTCCLWHLLPARELGLIKAINSLLIDLFQLQSVE